MPRFYSYPLNYKSNFAEDDRTSPAECADNRYDTYTESLSVICNLGEAREFTSVFVKGKGISRTIVTATGVNSSNDFKKSSTDEELKKEGATKKFSGSDRVVNDSNEIVSTIVENYQNILIDIHDIDSDMGNKPNSETVTFTFVSQSGQTVRIYEVLVLNELLRIEGNGKFRRIDLTDINLSSVHTGATGKISSVPALNNERDRWQMDYVATGANFPDNDTRPIIDQIRQFMREHKNFSCAIEPNRHPEMIAPCVFPDNETNVRLLGRSKKTGRTIQFSVRES